MAARMVWSAGQLSLKEKQLCIMAIASSSRSTRRGSEGDLSMSRQGIDNCGTEQIASLLKENSDVQVLDLGGNAIGEDSVSALCDAFRVTTTLYVV